MRSRWSKYPILKTVDISSYITIDSTSKRCTPTNEGTETLCSAGNFETWYPTAQWWGQWGFFYTPGMEGLLIRTADPTCAIQTWRFNSASNIVEVAFFGENTDLIIEIIEPDPVAALRVYRSWACQQPWFPTDNGRMNDLDVMAIHPHWGPNGEYTTPFLDALPTKRRSVWATGWHDKAFDVGYPRFVASSVNPAAMQLYEVTYDAPVFPYFNPVNVDERLTDWPVYDPTYLAVQKRGGSRHFNKQWIARGQSGYGTSNAYYLMWNCLANQKVRDQIISQFLALRTSDGQKVRGFYIDVAPGAIPGSNGPAWRPGSTIGSGGPCWAHSHDHEPGDPYAHQNATRILLKQIRDMGVRVMGESVAECHINDLDANLTFGQNGVNNTGQTRPYWKEVYGHARRDTFWQHPYSGQDDATTLASMIEAEEVYGHIMHGTPTNQTTWQDMMIDGNHPNTLARLNS
jgi:hypothetical protein